MIDNDDAAYYRRREAAERDLANRSGEAAIARIHSELADRYARHARDCIVPVIRTTV